MTTTHRNLNDVVGQSPVVPEDQVNWSKQSGRVTRGESWRPEE